MSSKSGITGSKYFRMYRPRIRAIALAFVLTFFWLGLSGYLFPLILILGVLSVSATVLLAIRMDLIDEEGFPIHLTWSAFSYLPWLFLEIVKSNLDVTKRVLSIRMPISPTTFETPVSQKSDLGQVIYANSITLTPGTVSVDLESGSILVHALSVDGAEGVLEGEMDKRVTKLEGLT